MNKDSSVPTAVAFIGFIIVAVLGFIVVKNVVVKNQEMKYQAEKDSVGKLSDLIVSINGINYSASCESTKAAEKFITNLPLQLEMNDINENEKRGQTYFKMTTDAKKLKKIEAGDILLSGESYVIIATQSFKSSDKYTKIGHIQVTGNIPKGNGMVIIKKAE